MGYVGRVDWDFESKGGRKFGWASIDFRNKVRLGDVNAKLFSIIKYYVEDWDT